jgi:hypothetical protein
MRNKILTVLVVVAALISCERMKEQFSGDMLQQIALLPQDANVVGYINVAKIHNSSFASLLPDSGKIQPFHDMDYQEFVEATGLDIRKDVQEIYGAANITDQNHEGSGIFVVKGRFDKDKIMAYISKKDTLSRTSCEKVDGIDFFHLDEKISLCFPDDQTIAGGATEIVKEWLSRKLAGPQQVVIDKKRKARLDEIKYKSTGWVYLDLGNSLDFINNENREWKNATEGVLNLTLSIQLNKKLALFSECECDNAEKAGLLQDALKGGIAALKLSQSDHRDVIDTLNKIQVKTRDKLVVSQFAMTKEDIERMIKAHGGDKKE